MKKTIKSNRKNSYRMNVYPVDAETDEMEWVAEIPDLPGCIGCGDTPEQAIEKVQLARDAWLEVAIKEGKPIPEPTNPYDIGYSGKFTLRIPKTLHRELAIKSQEEGISLNQYLLYIISKGYKDNYNGNREKKYKCRTTYEIEIKQEDVDIPFVRNIENILDDKRIELDENIIRKHWRLY